MTHRCRITLEIKSKMLNFNQATLMAWSEEWSLCLHWQAERGRDSEKENEGERDKLVREAQVRQGDMTF